jgi:hypothetical protein
MQSAYELASDFERRRARLGDTPTGLDLVQEFFGLARVAVDGYPAPDSDEDVVRVEANSRPEFHAVNLKREMGWLDADRWTFHTFFYLDMSFERRHEDQPLNWFSINYTEPRESHLEADLDTVARTLREHTGLQRILARTPLNVNAWVDGEVLNDF